MASKEFNWELQKRLKDFKVKNGLKLRDIASETGTSETAISRYLSGTPEGDIPALESKIEDFLRQSAKRREIDIPAFTTPATVMFGALAERIRRTGDVGLISGPAGIGKTKAIELYKAQNTTTLEITLSRWVRTDQQIMSRLWDQIETRGYRTCHCSRAEYLENKLVGSKRLIIVDNAHRARATGLQFLFDMHDATGCPIALVGNPEVLDVIRLSDQMFSRIGIYRDLSAIKGRNAAMMDDWMRPAARKLLQAIMPTEDEAVLTMAEEVAMEPGHLRTLKKQALLAADLIRTSSFQGRPAEAFSESGKLLVRNAVEED